MKKINIEKYKAEEGDVKEYQEFFVELDAKEIQTLANVLKTAMRNLAREITLSEFTELKNLHEKLSDFDNHTNQEDCRLELYTG